MMATSASSTLFGRHRRLAPGRPGVQPQEGSVFNSQEGRVDGDGAAGGLVAAELVKPLRCDGGHRASHGGMVTQHGVKMLN